ncbi:hypothetical protein ABG768_010539, partial [Culter alburnus]
GGLTLLEPGGIVPFPEDKPKTQYPSSTRTLSPHSHSGSTLTPPFAPSESHCARRAEWE